MKFTTTLLAGAMFVAIVPAASAQSLPSVGAELIVSKGKGLPAPKAEIAYPGDEDEAKADAFDVQLYSSLTSLRVVKVTLPAPAESFPTRISLWATRLEDKKNKIAYCDIDPSSSLSGEDIETVLKETVRQVPVVGPLLAALIPSAKRSVLYKPARNFHMIAEVDASDRKIRSVRFLRGNAEYNRAKSFYRKCVE